MSGPKLMLNMFCPAKSCTGTDRSHRSFTMYHVAAGLHGQAGDDGDLAHSGFSCTMWGFEKQEGFSLQKALFETLASCPSSPSDPTHPFCSFFLSPTPAAVCLGLSRVPWSATADFQVTSLSRFTGATLSPSSLPCRDQDKESGRPHANFSLGQVRGSDINNYNMIVGQFTTGKLYGLRLRRV